jgi:BolA protein
MDTVELIRQRLLELEPEQIEITDASAAHARHEGAKGGGGHYLLTIVSCKLVGKPALARHRLIYSLLNDMMNKRIHALGIKAYTPEEFNSTH